MFIPIIPMINRKDLEKKEDECDEATRALTEMENIFNGSKVAMRVVDEDFNVVKCNNAMLELTDTTKEQSYTMKCHEQLSGAACHTPNCTVVKIKNGTEMINVDADKTAPNGRKFPCNVWALPFYDADGNLAGIIETFEDISDRREKERQLESALNDAEGVFEGSSVAMRVVDEDFNIIKANQNMLDLSETTRDQAFGMKCYEQLSGAACHNENCTLVNAQKGREHIHAELDKTTHSGKTFPCDVWAVPYKDVEGNVIGIVETFNDISDRKQVVAKVHDSAITVASSSEELAASTEEMNAGMEELSSVVQSISQGAQNQSEQSVAASMEIKKIVDMAQNISESANLAADVSKDMNETAKSGSEAAERATQKMGEIFDVVNDSAVKIKELGEKSEEINEISKVITGIAEQTNLLALNAAIEAARAGEQGRGFAVVAEEVKKLAEGSAKAAEKISVIIKEIHKGTEIAVESMDRGTKEVEEGSVTVKEALSALEEVAKSVDVSSSRIINISSAAEEQRGATERAMTFIEEVAAGAEEAASTTEEMSAAVEEQTASMEEVSASAEKLSRVSSDLQEIAKTFSHSKTSKEAASKTDDKMETAPDAVGAANGA